MTAAKPSGPIRLSGPDDFRVQFGVSRESAEKLELYASELKRWQRTINLVAPSTLEDIWTRHFADSAQLLGLVANLQTSGRWVDLGSGAGFPGMVIAILRAGLPGAEPKSVTLVESDTRKAAFLGEIARRTATVVDIVPKRIEIVSTQGNLAGVQVVSARALAPLSRLLGLAHPFFGPDTMGLFPKGQDARSEVEAARGAWVFTARLEPSLTDTEARIAVVSGLAAARADGSRLGPRQEG
ncbi:MAG: 16S rRNA (guanine(527)-N(7))-methyltransferase RsmG [Hyphomicrobiaceae bacterium]|nr:16S rRNA (guanine(527)-N(7))-methyltransferase RsmG [Hyphomicrobiaceae bacterium]